MSFPLTAEQQAKTRFHLGYNLAVPDVDHARLFTAMNNVADAWTQTRLGELIVACDAAYDLTSLEAGTAYADIATSITGDLTRTTALETRDPYNRRLRAYLIQTNFLANTLGVRNYRDPEQAASGLIESQTTLETIPVLSVYETTTQLNDRDTANRDRANHTGTQAIATVAGLQDALDLLNSFTWLGQWDIATTYFVDDVVFHDGSSYIATAGNTGSEPPSNHWELFAQKGDRGEQGIQGTAGIQGDSAFQSAAKTGYAGTEAEWVAAIWAGSADAEGIKSLYEANADTNAYTDADKTKLDAITGTNTGDQDLSSYQVKPVEGAFVNGDKTKLDGIAAGAEVNVQSDWTAPSGDAHILNKPTLATVATSGAYSDLSGLPSLNFEPADATILKDADIGVTVQGYSLNTVIDADYTTVKSDVTANTSARHAAVTVVDSSEIDFTLMGQQITASIVPGSIDETKLDASVNASLDLADSATQPGDLSTVATSGAYTDLSGLPTLGTAAATASTDYATAAQGTLANTAVQPAAVRELLTADRTYYVRTDGNDSNNGLSDTAGGAFRTIQKAVDTVASLDLSIYSATIQVGNGTYNEVVTLREPPGTGINCFLTGNNSDVTAVVLSAPSGTALIVGVTSRWSVTWMTINSASGTQISVSGGYLSASNIRSTGVAFSFIASVNNGRVNLSSSITLEGSYTNIFVIQTGGSLSINNATLTVTGASMTGSFIDLRGCGIGYVRTSTVVGTIGTGKRYNVTINSIIDTAGAGTSFFPGLSDGTVSTGGQYA